MQLCFPECWTGGSILSRPHSSEMWAHALVVVPIHGGVPRPCWSWNGTAALVEFRDHAGLGMGLQPCLSEKEQWMLLLNLFSDPWPWHYSHRALVSSINKQNQPRQRSVQFPQGIHGSMLRSMQCKLVMFGQSATEAIDEISTDSLSTQPQSKCLMYMYDSHLTVTWPLYASHMTLTWPLYDSHIRFT